MLMLAWLVDAYVLAWLVDAYVLARLEVANLC